jgi:hypothetical protein
MSFLDSFIHGDALTQILIEGHNPYARQKLSTEIADAFRQHIHAPDLLLAYVLGREVMSGSGAWALTNSLVLIYHARTQQAHPIQRSQISHFEAVRGKYGHTVRLTAGGSVYAMYGVDAGLAQQMHDALASQGVSSSFEHKPARGTLWAAYSPPAPAPEQCLADARQRLLVG